MRMLIDHPVLLPNIKKLLFLPSSPEMIHPLYPKLELLMCYLSGDLLKTSRSFKDHHAVLEIRHHNPVPNLSQEVGIILLLMAH